MGARTTARAGVLLALLLAACGEVDGSHDPLVNGPDADSLTTYWQGDPCTLENSQGYCTVAPFSFALAADGTLLWSVTVGTTGEWAFGRSTWTRLGDTAIVLNDLPLDGIPSLNLHDIRGSFSEGIFTARHRNQASEDHHSTFTIQTGRLPGYCGCVDTPPPNTVGTGECVEAPDGYCTYTGCSESFFDCNGDRHDGCEVSGSEACSGLRAVTGIVYGCAPDTCDYVTCGPVSFDCDGDRTNGCEVDSDYECRTLRNVVDVGYECTAGCTFACMPGFLDCDAEPSNGCEVDGVGSCAGIPNVTGATYDCATSSCILASCVEGTFDCNESPGDGCEHLGTACPVQLTPLAAAFLAVDGVNVYFSDAACANPYGCAGGMPVLRSVPVGGGAATTLASGQYAAGLAVDATHVYWAVAGGSGPFGVRRIPKSGGAVEVVAAYPSPAYFVALGASDVYFTTWGNVYSVPKTGGAWTMIGPGTYGVTADAANVYVMDAAVWQHPIGGGPSVQLDASDPATGAQGAIVVDGSDVYWNSAGDGLFRVAIGGGVPALVAAGGSGRFALAIDETYVYWTGGDTLWATPKAGGADIIVASNTSATSIAVDGTNVYWARGSDGIWSTPRP